MPSTNMAAKPATVRPVTAPVTGFMICVRPTTGFACGFSTWPCAATPYFSTWMTCKPPISSSP